MSAKNSFRIKKGRRNGGTPTPTSLPGCSCSMNNTNGKTNGNDVGVGVPPFLRPFHPVANHVEICIVTNICHKSANYTLYRDFKVPF